MFHKAIAGILSLAVVTQAALAADHGDSPIGANDQAMDLGDVYAFLDPNDNSKVFLGMTVRGFIVPGEAVNFGFFDHLAQYRFELETTGDAKADRFITVKFSKRAATNTPQIATIRLPFGRSFTAPTTLPNLSPTASAPTITTDPVTGISFFAGIVDDPFFFDIPGFSRFVSSVRAGAADPSLLNRGRNTFDGYNTLAIALNIPVSFLRLPSNATGAVLGVNGAAQRRTTTVIAGRNLRSAGAYKTLDRAANPGLNAVVIPFARKDEYNLSTTQQDKNGRFASDIVATLTALGTNQTNINTLASVYVSNGDFLRLNTSVANSGPKGGTNTGAGFPNGRRLADDVIDTFLTVVANGTPLGDGTNASDIPPRNEFPFFAAPQQPSAAGTIDDNTRN